MPDESPTIAQQKLHVVLAGAALLAPLLCAVWLLPLTRSASASVDQSGAAPASQSSAQAKAPVSIDYPEDGSIFPPGITPPTFIWRDASATSWRISISFGDKAPAIRAISRGERMKIGPIDPDCISNTNKPPSLTPQQAESWTWTPDAAAWNAIQLHSTAKPATITITGYNQENIAVSESHSTFTTSKDPVGAPIFYRDVPLMPSAGADGVVQPLSADAIHLIHWRLRDIRQPEARIVIKSVPTCMNCHSFSMDGKTLGIDVDGPANDKGMYAVVPVSKHIAIENKDVLHWETDGEVGTTRVGFMSQVSPDGQFVVGTFAGPALSLPKTYYITNFTDYRFLQVFYPTRGILEWYSRATGLRKPLPGADDPHYVQTDGVWSPDGKYIVFARAEAKNPREKGQPLAQYANDPNETQIQYDLYRIPFNEGRGGTPERIAGASQNGMSNNFPKVSPDGRWIVFVQCKNGQLMRPDSQLYIVPFGGGEARRLRANTSLMNSWHSFSPNGRWLVFSSKARSPYTQMYLTHIDANGDSSPPILIDNATAANRAVNLPEFVNIAGDGIEEIATPAIEGYRLMDEALKLEGERRYAEALAAWRKAVALEPDDARVQTDIAANLFLSGEKQEAIDHVREAVRINPALVQPHYYLGAFLLEEGHPDQAVPELEEAVTLNPRFPSAEEALASAYCSMGDDADGLAHWRREFALDPKRVSAAIGEARILASSPNAALRDGQEAVALAEQANQLTQGQDPNVLDTLGAAFAQAGDYAQALAAADKALDLAIQRGENAEAEAIRARINLYSHDEPYIY
jgi:tetratricopeptide (TPR) repeat protein